MVPGEGNNGRRSQEGKASLEKSKLMFMLSCALEFVSLCLRMKSDSSSSLKTLHEFSEKEFRTLTASTESRGTAVIDVFTNKTKS